MKLKYLVLVLAVVGTSVSAQIQQVNNGSLNELVFYVGTNKPKYDAEAEGSPYLNEEFAPARINGIEETQFVRFNAVESTIELKDEDKILTLSNAYSYSIKLLNGSDQTYETHSFSNEDGTSGISFFEKLYVSKKFALYQKERIIYTAAKKAKSSYEQDLPAKFKRGRTLFYITDPKLKSTGLLEFPKKKKNLSNLFEKQTKPMEKYIKKEGLKMNSTEDIIKIMNFYYERN
ncbi:MAG: hypothetical protein ABJN95_19185 [Maribacter sp.]|uniref:hypothetical protein n=1 Tax=Maribacter sp. TaxID=1897614 RepID=UPI003299F38C